MQNVIRLKISKGLFTTIDKSVYDDLKQKNLLKWNAQKSSRNRFYVSKNYKNKKLYLHRYIMGMPDNVIIDHIDRNPLNNVKSNLRIATARQNAKNTDFKINSKYGLKGITKVGKSFGAQIQISNKHFNLGHFSTAEDAARVYDIVEVIINGHLAQPNFQTSMKFAELRNFLI